MDGVFEAVTYVNLVNMCELLHQLPRSGGIFDQDAYTMEVMFVVLKHKAAKSERDQKAAERKKNK